MFDATGMPPDTAIDAGIDDGRSLPSDTAGCFGGSFVTVCLQSPPTMPRLITDALAIDTSDSPTCTPTASVTGGDVCVLAGTTITISATLRATGAKPLVLVASDSISIESSGTIDVGSHSGLAPGAGTSAPCLLGTSPSTGNGTSGGGAGGSFAATGGTGGVGGGAAGGAPGMPGGSLAVLEVRGGCPGQDGAGNLSGLGGHGGHGGGALFLIAGAAIDVSGTILAGGERGGGGNPNRGGGGGGSGGLIGFQALQITGNGLAVASGGGGGEGGGVTSGIGQDGSDGTALAAAAGGSGGTDNGGDGGAGSGPGGPGGGNGMSGSVNSGGGGGGGGGAGYIRSNVALGAIQTSPPPMVVP